MRAKWRTYAKHLAHANDLSIIGTGFPLEAPPLAVVPLQEVTCNDWKECSVWDLQPETVLKITRNPTSRRRSWYVVERGGFSQPCVNTPKDDGRYGGHYDLNDSLQAFHCKGGHGVSSQFRAVLRYSGYISDGRPEAAQVLRAGQLARVGTRDR